jgi:hypothetical protein
MPGHMGSDRRTVQNLRVVRIIADKNLLLIKGAIPGANGDDVVVRTSIKGQPKVMAPRVEVKDPKAAKAAAKPAPAKEAKKA